MMKSNKINCLVEFTEKEGLNSDKKSLYGVRPYRGHTVQYNCASVENTGL